MKLKDIEIRKNKSAMALYKKYGFENYGLEPRSLKINEQFYDEYLMVLRLDK